MGTNHFGLHFGVHFGVQFGGLDYDNPDIGDLAVDNVEYGGSAYPFLLMNDASLVILDLHVSTILSERDEVEVRSIAGVGDPGLDPETPAALHDVDLELVVGDTVMIDTRQMTFTDRLWNVNIWVYCWQSPDTVIQAVVRKDPLLLPHYRFTGAVLDPRVLSFRPKGVTDVRIRQPSGWVSAIRSDGSMRVRAGYNMRYSSESLVSARGERVSRLIVSAQPGAGLGRFPACDANVGITALGGSLPTSSGNLAISGDDCISFEPKVVYSASAASVTPGSYIVRDDCHARCSYEDFSAVANRAIAVWNQMSVLASRIMSIRDGYHAVREQLIDWGRCSQANPLKLNIWRAPPCGIGLGFGIANVSNECLTGLSLTLRMTDLEDTLLDGSVLEQGGVYAVQYLGTRAFSAAGSYTELDGTFTFELAPIKPGQVGYVFVRYELPVDACDQTGRATVSLVGELPTGWSEVEPVTLDF